MTPGTLLMMFFVDQIVDAIKRPGIAAFAIAVVLILLIVGGIFGLRKWLYTERS